MRFKHTKTILLIIINLLFLSLFISGNKRFKGFVNKSLSGSVCQGHPTRESSEKKGKMFKVQEGIFGTSYVTAYYPTKDGQPVEEL